MVLAGNKWLRLSWWGRSALIIAILLTIVVLVQLLYPRDRVMPFARLAGESVGGMTTKDIEKKLLADYAKTALTTTVLGKKAVVRLPQTGFVIDNETIKEGLTDYPMLIRLVPFSLLWQGTSVNQPVALKVDQGRYAQYYADRAEECKVQPKDASVTVRENKVVLDPAKEGEACSKESLKQQVLAAPVTKQGITLKVNTTVVKPERSDEAVLGLLKDAETVVKRNITISVLGKKTVIPQDVIASWLVFPEDKKTNKLSIGVNDQAIAKYLSTLEGASQVAPGTTVVTTHDGVEVSRVNGQEGRGIDSSKTVTAIKTQALKDSGTVEAAMAVLPPTVTYSRTYSKTTAGLQALVNDLTKDKPDLAISVRKLNEPGVHANGDKTFHPASTYKLAVAYSVLKRIESGMFYWEQGSSGGQTVSQCFDNMIVNSDNACAEWFAMAISWSALTNEARSVGMAGTSFGNPFVSTTNDMALFLQKLETKQLGLAESSRARLLDAMNRQAYRKGIPAGVGVPVADKVGFLNGLLHDAAIVYAPNGPYVMVIYSNNSSWGAIADIAKQIHTQLQ